MYGTTVAMNLAIIDSTFLHFEIAGEIGRYLSQTRTSAALRRLGHTGSRPTAAKRHRFALGLPDPPPPPYPRRCPDWPGVQAISDMP